MSSGHPSFDVVNVALHVQKRLIEKGRWMEDLRPLIADKTLTNPDLDMADFSEATIRVATGPDGKINVLPMNQDVWILFYNKEMFEQAGLPYPPKTYDEMMDGGPEADRQGQGRLRLHRPRVKNANVRRSTTTSCSAGTRRRSRRTARRC